MLTYAYEKRPRPQRSGYIASLCCTHTKANKTSFDMNFEKVVFAFFIILALSVNTSFLISGLIAPDSLQTVELWLALSVSLICTFLKFGDRTQFGSTVLASSLVVDILLIGAAIIWGVATHNSPSGLSSTQVATVLSLAGGALIANFLSVVLLIIETSQLRR